MSQPLPKRVKKKLGGQLLSAINQVACYDSPVPLMDHLSQVILEVDNYDAIYELPFLDKLCQMQSNISKQLS
uniref:Uncharacterized protein n=1 Tax=Caenorhabditis japonica TaxID=281687 RepID=A0A8R1IQA4_CAEJA